MERAITPEQLFMGRDTAYREEWTLQIARNGLLLLDAVNPLIELSALQGITPQALGPWGYVASGWRPKAVNDKTSNAAKSSAHLEGLAVDLHDWPDRRFARWCLRNLAHLTRLGLYAEDPRWSPTWLHLQIRAPGSGHRVFIPSSAPPLALALPEQATNA